MFAIQQPVDIDPGKRTLAIVLAGGAGSRLGELTRGEAKPALPFGGQYRNIDFPLSNCINSDIRRIAVATQYKAHTLIQHIQHGWHFLRPELGECIELWPAQQRCGDRWYAGTADAIYQNLDLMRAHSPEYVLVLAGDHIYRMDYRRMLLEHADAGADVTIGCIEVPMDQAAAFGVVQADLCNRVTSFEEKPARVPANPTDPRTVLASMGIYLFNRKFLVASLRRDAADSGSRHDFGHDVLPAAAANARVHAHRFREAEGAAPAYWRDVGTLDSYWLAHMELLADRPPVDLGDPRWPIRTHQVQRPPALFTATGSARRALITAGCRIAGSVERSVLSADCDIGADAIVEDSVLLPGAKIGRGCHITRAVVAAGCTVPDGLKLGGTHVDDPGATRSAEHRVALITASLIERATTRGGQLKLA